MRKISLFLLSLTLTTSVLLAEPHAFPVPFTPNKDASHKEITFTNLPVSGTIKIYTVDGRLVAEVVIPTGQGTASWLATNKSGEKVASGVYIYRVGGDTGKLVIIR